MIEIPYFSLPDRESELDLIRHLIDFGDEMVLMTGRVGVGKTRLLQVLLESLVTEKDIIRFDGVEFTELSQFFALFAQTVGFDDAEVQRNQWIIALQYHLIKSYPNEAPLIVIDNADALSDELLEGMALLASLQNENRKLVRILIVGNLDVKEQVDNNVDLSFKVRTIEIFPLDDDQMGDFIDYLIQQPDSIFPQKLSYDEKQYLIEESSGLPARLLMLVDDASFNRPGSRRYMKIMVSIIIIAVVAFAYLMLQQEDVTPSSMKVKEIELPLPQSGGVEKTASIAETAVENPKTGSIAPVQTATEVEPPKKPLKKLLIERTLSLEKITPQKFKSPQTVKVVLYGEGFEKNSKVVLLRQGDDKLINLDPLNVLNTELTFNPGKLLQGEYLVQVVNDNGTATAPLKFNVEGDSVVVTKNEDKTSILSKSSVLVEKKPVVVKKAVKLNWEVNSGEWYTKQDKSAYVIQLFVASQRESIDMMIATLTDTSQLFSTFVQIKNGSPLYVLTEGLYSQREEAEKAAERFKPVIIPWVRTIESITSVMQTLVTKDPIRISSDGLINDDAWVWSQDPTAVTIQIAGGPDRAALEQLTSKYKIPSPLAIMKISRQNKTWFILVSGLYQNRNLARTKIAGLPQALVNMGPWIRSFASIHDELSL